MTFWDDFYLYFTNWSNYLCFGVMLTELIQTAKKKADSNVTAVPLLKFIGLLGILLTFLVFNLLLAGEKTRNPALNYKVNSVLFHIVLPILYIADWIFFYKRRETKWTYPVYSALFPIIYIIFIFSRAYLLNSQGVHNAETVIYPYFFLNIDKQGVPGVVSWCIALALGFIFVGFLFAMVDRLVKTSDSLKEKWHC